MYCQINCIEKRSYFCCLQSGYEPISRICNTYRLIKCLIELKWLEDAVQFIMRFKIQFQKHSDSQALKTLEKRLQEVESELKEAEEKHKRFNRFEPSSSPNGDDR